MTVSKIDIKLWNPERLPEQCTSNHLCYYRGRQIHRPQFCAVEHC